MNASVSSCPVPLEQQPLQEYSALKESWFYRWATLSLRGYLTPLTWIWGASWLISGPIAAGSFSPTKYPIQFALTGAAGASLLLSFFLLRLYLGWFYIRDRLVRETVFYEESGWYDGQYWAKPLEVLTRDRLIVTYEIQPILQRLQRTCYCLGALFVMGILIWAML
ncbi:MAG: CGLD27 family protein [Leptolyngbyaceae bacterium]|nr:CGLD27 family protein [Leptolyngbyaceae bacterium]